MLRESRPVSRRSSLSAIAWPYRWLFALTECGEQRSPAPRLCECVGTDAHSGPAHTDAAPVRVRSETALYSIYAKASYSGHARGEEFRGGGRIVNCYEVDFGPEIPK